MLNVLTPVTFFNRFSCATLCYLCLSLVTFKPFANFLITSKCNWEILKTMQVVIFTSLFHFLVSSSGKGSGVVKTWIFLSVLGWLSGQEHLNQLNVKRLPGFTSALGFSHGITWGENGLLTITCQLLLELGQVNITSLVDICYILSLWHCCTKSQLYMYI